MKFHMFSIYDEKARSHLPPFVLPEEGMAIRTFSDCINSIDHQFSKHPSDYTLIKIANYDDESGEVIQDRRTIGNGIEFKNPDQEQYDEPQTWQQQPHTQRS